MFRSSDARLAPVVEYLVRHQIHIDGERENSGGMSFEVTLASGDHATLTVEPGFVETFSGAMGERLEQIKIAERLETQGNQTLAGLRPTE